MSFIVSDAQQTDKCLSGGSSLSAFILKKEEQVEEDDFTFDEPCPKKQKTSCFGRGHPVALPSAEAQNIQNELNMNWDLIEVSKYNLEYFICLIYYIAIM